MTVTQSTRLQTVYALLDAYSTLNPDNMLANLSDDFTHQILPESIGMPPRERAAFAEHAKGITAIFTKFAMKPKSVFEDPERNAVIVYANMDGELQGGLGPWVNECIMIMKLNDDGTKVVDMKEFVDSARAAMFKEKLGQLMGKKGADGLMHE